MNAPAKPSLHRGRGLKLKLEYFPVTVLELFQYDNIQFPLELTEKVTQNPEAFEYHPVLLDIKSLSSSAKINFEEIKNFFAEHSIELMGVLGGNEQQQEKASEAHFNLFPPESLCQPLPHKDVTIAIEEPTTIKPSASPEESKTPSVQTSKIISIPVRSGQQVYAPEGDLIILAPVSTGAEILASGNIHVYGALRGRALAGVNGDTNARIFCHQLEAELVSIAGQYKISEDLQNNFWKSAVQIKLEEDKLIIQELA